MRRRRRPVSLRSSRASTAAPLLSAVVIFISCRCDLCEALSIAGRRRVTATPLRTTIARGLNSSSAKLLFCITQRNNVGNGRSIILPFLFEKNCSNCNPLQVSGEGTVSSSSSPLETRYRTSRRRKKKSSRRRMQLLSQSTGRIWGKLSSTLPKDRVDFNDVAFGAGRAGYFPNIGAKASQGSNRGVAQATRSKYSQSTSMATSSTGARITRARSLADSTSVFSSSRASTALRMVLSTPDTIIEQASTEKLIDALLDESTRTHSRRSVMMQFNPKPGWIWRQWRGTVFSETWKSGMLNMALATAMVFLYRLRPGSKDSLRGFGILWGQLLSVTTFTLTFFVNQSYGLWRKCYDYSRIGLQGHLNDLGMTLAAHATRTKPSSPDLPSTYTPQSRQALELASRYVRVFNLLTYASFTRSHRPILTPRGMRRMVERGILTAREMEILSNAEIPATQRHNAVLVWLIRLFLESKQAGVFEGGIGFEQQFMEKCHVIRSQYGAIGDELQGRMPLAYVHIVQVLLDVVLWMYPLMALSSGMAWHISILGTGLLTMFYQGLFDLAKQFLDPYDNESYGKGDDPLVIDTLIAETNAGSVRWMNSFQQQPWNKQLLNDGEMFDSILPLRGYSVEELVEATVAEEREKRERESVIEEKKQRQLEDDRKKAERMLMGHVSSMENETHVAVAEKWNETAVLTPAGEALMGGVTYDGANGNGTLMEVSRGKVVATSSLLPNSHLIEMNDAGTNLEPEGMVEINIVAEMESNKILTLADGTLVDAGCDSVTMNATEPNMTTPAGLVSEDVVQNTTSSDISVADEDSMVAEISPLPNDTDVVVQVQLGGKVRHFEESIAEMEEYDKAPSLLPQPPSPLLPLFNTQNDNIVYDSRPSDEELENSKWFDEIGLDGQEYRLSQMLADEDWSLEGEGDEAENKLENKTMTYKEFTQKATEIIERAENELEETKEIMSVSPGSNAEYNVRDWGDTRRKVTDTAEPLYDQTRLDAISQLWGLPPEVLERNIVEDDDNSKQNLINDGMDFKNVYSLWGEDIRLDAAALDDEEMSTTSPPQSMAGFSQLWNKNLSPYKGEAEDNDMQAGANSRSGDYSVYADLDWWDEISEEGKELRLSQMLADEVYEEAIEEGEGKPMTFEQFTEETEKLIEQAEDERKQTEAIMNAPPNANFLEAAADADEISPGEKRVVASEKYVEMMMSMAEGEGNDEEDNTVEEEIISDEEIGVLEMDDNPDENEELITSNNSSIVSDEVDEWQDEISDDGQELRLSQMLANELYEEAIEEGDGKPMTFDHFAEERERLIEQTEDERKETEAIMNASPNANFVQASTNIEEISSAEDSTKASEKCVNIMTSLAEGEGEGNNEEENVKEEEIISDEEIGVLEMDENPDENEGLIISNNSLTAAVEGDEELRLESKLSETPNGYND